MSHFFKNLFFIMGIAFFGIAIQDRFIRKANKNQEFNQKKENMSKDLACYFTPEQIQAYYTLIETFSPTTDTRQITTLAELNRILQKLFFTRLSGKERTTLVEQKIKDPAIRHRVINAFIELNMVYKNEATEKKSNKEAIIIVFGTTYQRMFNRIYCAIQIAERLKIPTKNIYLLAGDREYNQGNYQVKGLDWVSKKKNSQENQAEEQQIMQDFRSLFPATSWPHISEAHMMYYVYLRRILKCQVEKKCSVCYDHGIVQPIHTIAEFYKKAQDHGFNIVYTEKHMLKNGRLSRPSTAKTIMQFKKDQPNYKEYDIYGVSTQPYLLYQGAIAKNCDLELVGVFGKELNVQKLDKETFDFSRILEGLASYVFELQKTEKK